jgi:hypothetical protein
MRNVRILFWSAALILAGHTLGYSQIPNAGFESWNLGEPDGWLTDNSDVLQPVTSTTDAHGGSAALQGTVLSLSGTIKLTPSILSGPGGRGFPVQAREAALHGWYKYSHLGNEVFNITLIMEWTQNTIGGGGLLITDAQSTYREFALNILYQTGDTPDTCIISAAVFSFAEQPTAGTFFILDDLSFGPATSVDASGNAIPVTFRLSQNFPNPFNPSTTIQYSVPRASRVKLSVYDLLGRELAVLVDGDSAPGSYRVVFDGTRLSSGTYFYRLQAGEFSQTKQFVLLK